MGAIAIEVKLLTRCVGDGSASLKLPEGKKFQLIGTPIGQEFKELSGTPLWS